MIYLRQAAERGHANRGWLDSRFTFSFSEYQDPNFMGFSSLRVINEDKVLPQTGFGTHPHNNMEILTYVLQGMVEHKDSMGNRVQVKAGEFQIMSAGSGVTHSEYNPCHQDTLHLYQIWIVPNQMNTPPRYEQKKLEQTEGKTLLLSPDGKESLFKIYQNMSLWHYNLKKGSKHHYAIQLDRAVWIQVVAGNIEVNGQKAETSDGLAIAKESQLTILAHSDSEILLFDLP